MTTSQTTAPAVGTAAQVGRLIRTAREAAGISQVELARRLDVTQTAVSYWEAGKRTPAVDDLLTVARALDVAAARLLPADRNHTEEQAARVTADAEPVEMALDGIRRSWQLDDFKCQQLALLDAIAWGLIAVAGGRRNARVAVQVKAPEPGTGELGTWKPEVIRAVQALRELDWTGFDPTSLDDLADVAAAVVNESDATFTDVLPASTD